MKFTVRIELYGPLITVTVYHKSPKELILGGLFIIPAFRAQELVHGQSRLVKSENNGALKKAALHNAYLSVAIISHIRK